MRFTKFIGSDTRGHAAALNTNGTANAVTNTRHCLFSSGRRSSTASTGLTTSDRPIATPAHHWSPTFPDSSQRKNSTSASRTQPLILVKTMVLVTDSVQNIASSSAGSATDVSEKPNSRTNRQAAMIIATVLIATNQLWEAKTGM